MNQSFQAGEAFARQMDLNDPLAHFREEFHIPQDKEGNDLIYLAGNSLGLQPRRAKAFIEQELEDWARLGVQGHVHARKPWTPYHENLTEQTARLVGAKPIEVVVMNTLSVNLHLMMVSFYRPTPQRFKILIEKGAFPSDQYAVASQVRFHGFDPKEAILELSPREGEDTLRNDDILNFIDQHGTSIALILIGNVNYLTGQAFDIPAITSLGHAKGCQVGFDLAHGVGNLFLKLHEWGPDFAVWCSYKYLNSGPGSLAGCFVHERHANSESLPRFCGWWGHQKETRFKMGPDFKMIPGAEGWQLSNPPIFQLAALRASLEIFDQATLPALRRKSETLTSYLHSLLDLLPKDYCEVTTPRDPHFRGAQLSMRLPRLLQNPRGGKLGTQSSGNDLLARWARAGIICDFREPDIIRAAPTALYNRYIDVYRFVEILKEDANGS